MKLNAIGSTRGNTINFALKETNFGVTLLSDTDLARLVSRAKANRLPRNEVVRVLQCLVRDTDDVAQSAEGFVSSVWLD